MSGSAINTFGVFASDNVAVLSPRHHNNPQALRLESAVFGKVLNPSDLRQKFQLYPLGTDSSVLSEEAMMAFEAQNINGSENNEMHPMMNQAHKNLARLAPSQYSDGVSSLGGADRSNPRFISNVVFDQQESIPDERGLSGMTWLWGQFLAHDTDLTPDKSGEIANVEVPIGDEHFDPMGKGGQSITLKRSLFDKMTGTDEANPREQENVITGWVDGGVVYGSDDERAKWIRTGENGKLKVSEGNFMPYNDGTQDNARIGMADGFFVAGDARSNEHSALISLHTLFVREHNRLADEIKAANPGFTDDEIYDRARKINAAQIPSITYNEYLPALLGEGVLDEYQGYDPSVDATVTNEFSTALFRYGHSTIEEVMFRLDEEGNEIPEGHLTLRDAFWDPKKVTEEGGIDPVLRGIVTLVMEKVDTKFVDSLRNFLFGQPGQGGMDLASLNIQRGRDHGLADYNTVREALGLQRRENFSDITSDPILAEKLELAYGSVDNIDLWVGALAEDHVEGASVGETTLTGMKDQFERLREGDRFFYEGDSSLSASDKKMIRNTTLADIIKRNTDIKNIADNSFFSPDHQPI
ncbi:MAG: hypothetical protein O3B01_04415 [Planctomycetota bacterium]|nr:hypothetical protein [Planctomycetota bacterium]